MLYMVVSRIAYALPLICYGAYTLPMEAVNYMAIWVALFLSTVFFFSFGRFNPCLLAHVTFLSEAYLLFKMGVATGDANWFLFILLTSFFAIEALRNQPFHIFFHLSTLILTAFMVARRADIGIASYTLSGFAPYILVSPLLCRGILSAIESKDVVIQRVVKRTRVLVPSVNEEKLVKAAKENEKKAKRFELRNEAMEREVERLSKERDSLKYNLESERASNSLDEGILQKYFELCAEPPSDLSKSVDDNVDYILNLAMKVLGCTYISFVCREGDDAYLSNAVGQKIDEDALVDFFSDKIYSVIKRGNIETVGGAVLDKFSFGRLCFVPVLNKNINKGVLIIGFNGKEELNGHYGNLALVCGCRIAALID